MKRKEPIYFKDEEWMIEEIRGTFDDLVQWAKPILVARILSMRQYLLILLIDSADLVGFTMFHPCLRY